MKKRLLQLSIFLFLASTTQAYYQAEQGRWLNRDPIEEWGGVNVYGLVENDPVNYIDYIGLSKKVFCYKLMLSTAYSDKGPGSDWKEYKPKSAGEGVGSVGPGTIAVANTDWTGVGDKAKRTAKRAARPAYPYGMRMDVHDPDVEFGKGSRIYTGNVHDTGKGHTKERNGEMTKYEGDPSAWIDLWMKDNKSALDFGAKEVLVVAQFCDKCPSGWSSERPASTPAKSP